MKLFRKDSSYAVRTLVYIAQQNQSEPISSTRVSQELGIPRNFLRRIYSLLIQAKILKATEGARGGVKLAKAPEKISVWEIIHALQGDIRVCDTNHSKEPCKDSNTCLMRKKIIGIEKLIVNEFRKITIQTLIEDSGSKPYQKHFGK
ncbi:MAG: Rrf2 family transcriptional regulator [Planctomycetaceae bacterium]|nr:Rrf2 family transcriptional regulator [Planctomycetaceae bacterium]